MARDTFRIGEGKPDVSAAGGVLLRRDGSGQTRVAVIHRPKYGDWSLPKGKLEDGEGWREGALREVEDNLSTLRILGDEAAVQQQALAAARQSVELTTNQYKAGLVGFLNVVVVQAQAFAAERNAIDLAGRRLSAAVALIKALGGPYPSPV